MLAACVGDPPGILSGDGGDIDDAGGTLSDAAGGSEDAATDAPVEPREDAGDSATAPPPEPPILAPNAWLDARNLQGTSITTWPDSTSNTADAVAHIAHAVSPTALGGKPGVVFTGETGQAFEIAANKLSAFRVYNASVGFSVFVVASYREGVAERTAQAVLFARRLFTPLPTYRLGVQLSLEPTLTNAEGVLWSYDGSTQVATTAAGAAPSKDAPHLYVFRGQNNTATVRVDGAIVQTSPGFVENNFASNGDRIFSIGSYDGSGTHAQFGWIGAIGMVAIYTRALADADIEAGEQAAKEAWGIP